MNFRNLCILTALVLAAGALAGCVSNNGGAGGEKLQQAGSSTVFPIAAAWAEALAPGLQVTVAGGGSGAGASKLCAKEIDIGTMSRPFKDSEKATCASNGVTATEWPVAYDGLTVVVAKSNAFIDHLTVDELKHIWRANDPARTWADVRAGWPAERIVLYGPDSDSGTYEYFNEEILGKNCGADGKSICPPRSDYTASADDNRLVHGVVASPHAIGHFGFSYFHENQNDLKAVPIVPPGGSTPVAPTFETIADGSYKPLARPLFMVTNGVPASGTPLHEYLSYAFGDGQKLVRSVGYVELDAAKLAEMKGRLG
ncbi:MAG TPA: phosphate ABC transporter substrate-binding protein PstS family protein [Candidatus Thermoplasmatota archaeon]|nr:phosphate ABC transporter substrate-binding protein PstS family protein [Candidatus Thermoplasmatota archaeon]